MIQKHNLRVSIVIPVYNEAAALSDCLEALALQSVAPYEVIVVDNNSTDGSRAIAERFDFVRVVTEPRQGVVHARTRGFNAAGGDIIGRIDADSRLPRDWVEHVRRFYSQLDHRHQAFSGAAYFYDVRWSRAVSWLYSFLVSDFNRLLIGHPTLWGSNMAVTRGQWRAVQRQICTRNGQHEDLDLAIHLRRNGFDIFYDRHFRVGASMRRVHANRQELWEYLQWWPRTLRRHGKRGWPVCWFFGALLLYAITPLLGAGERVARRLGRTSLAEALGSERI
jgi:glycosyltransferase involved in cell wall biosynthesis